MNQIKLEKSGQQIPKNKLTAAQSIKTNQFQKEFKNKKERFNKNKKTLMVQKQLFIEINLYQLSLLKNRN